MGGSEGFTASDVVLLHKEGTESTETSQGFERTFTGKWQLLAWGGGPCLVAEDPAPPEGEGWEESDEEPSDADKCESYKSALEYSGSIYASPSKKSMRALTVQLNDLGDPNYGSYGTAEVTECRAPNEDILWEQQSGLGVDSVLLESFEEFEAEILGDRARIQLEIDTRLHIDWTVRYCSY